MTQDNGNGDVKNKDEEIHSYYHLSPEAGQCLASFKYNGADLSPIYNYVLSPLAAYLVEKCTPRWIAPNSITLFGLCWMITSYLIVWYYCPSFDDFVEGWEDTVPLWIFFFNGMAMLIYQTLDNMDGKQARRTGSSSSLGLLFDHGCDAINSIFGSANWIVFMGLNPIYHLPQIWILVFIPMILFFIATWEEYYTGKLILPVFNGPTEGLLIGASLSILTSFVGRQFWHETSGYQTFLAPVLPEIITKYIPQNGITNFNMVVLATIIGAIREAVERTYNVVGNYGVKTILNLLPVISMSFLAYYICSKEPGVFIRNPRTCLHLSSLIFFDQVTAMMLNHMSCVKYNPFRKELLPLVIFAVIIEKLSNDLKDQYILLYTVALLLYISIKTKQIVQEICTYLGIWCFDIVTPHPLKASAEKTKSK